MCIAGPLAEMAQKAAAEAERRRQIDKGPNEANLYVGFLPMSVDTPGLRRLFESFGEITECKVYLFITFPLHPTKLYSYLRVLFFYLPH